MSNNLVDRKMYGFSEVMHMGYHKFDCSKVDELLNY